MKGKAILPEPIVVEERPFPKLMIADDGLIVHFSEVEYGMVVVPPNQRIASNARYVVGYRSNGWTMDEFEDYEGKVELSND